MYQLILHKLQAACCIERAAGGMRVARGSKVELVRASVRVCVCVCVRVRMTVVVCFLSVITICSAQGQRCSSSDSHSQKEVKVLGVMAIILIIIILKTSLQVIRGSLWRREPLKSISESYCFQWKIKPTQDCCEDAARLVCEMWSYLPATCGTFLLLFSRLSGSTEEQRVCLLLPIPEMNWQYCVPERCTYADLRASFLFW